MTVGKDVSALFPDVVNCMQTDNLELKKLVYLYLMNYAKSQPDMAIMAVNTFVKDCEDTNPLIRALAVRTMGCIRLYFICEVQVMSNHIIYDVWDRGFIRNHIINETSKES